MVRQRPVKNPHAGAGTCANLVRMWVGRDGLVGGPRGDTYRLRVSGLIRNGGSVWESNPPAAPLGACTLVLKTRGATGPLALPPAILRGPETFLP